jgi:hypothetical protein
VRGILDDDLNPDNNNRIQMRRTMGINRNKMELLQAAKNNQVRKRNMYLPPSRRFKYIGKEDEPSESKMAAIQLRTPTTATTSSPPPPKTQPTASKIWKITPLSTSTTRPKTTCTRSPSTVHPSPPIGKKMTADIKLRMASFKETDIKTYDDNISKYSSKAIEVDSPPRSTWSRARRS